METKPCLIDKQQIEIFLNITKAFFKQNVPIILACSYKLKGLLALAQNANPKPSQDPT